MTAPTPVQQADRPEGWWAYPGVYAVGVYLLAYLPNLAWWVGLPFGVVLAALGKVLARHTFGRDTHGETFNWWAQVLGVLSGLAAGVWLTAARLLGGPLVTWQWLAWGTAGFGLGHLLLLWLAPSAAKAHAKAPPVDSVITEVALQVFYQRIVSKIGDGDVRVTGVKISPSGGVESVYLTPALPEEGVKPKLALTRSQFEGRLPALVVALDQALYRRQPKPARIDDQDVHVEHGAGGSEWIMHVTVARPLDVDSYFVPVDAPQPWCGPKRCGRYEDDVPMLITFCDEQQGAADGEFVGMKGSGKTGALNVIIARHLESDQGEVWLVGTNKLTKMARPWLEPWLRGETPKPVIDWVGGEGPQAALRALASAYQYAVECNRRTKGNDARKPSRGRGALLVVLEEAPDLLERNNVTVECCDGVKRNASQLSAKLQDISRSAPVELWKVSQNALFDSFGSDGAKQRRNIGIGVAGKCRTPQDAQRVIPGLPRANPTKLRSQAVFVEQLYDEPREVRARYDFIPDPRIPELARRYTPWRHGLDPDVTKRMPLYADRWAPQWHAALIREIEAEGLVWPTAPAHTGSVPGPDQPQDASRDEPQDTTREEPMTSAYRDPTELVDLWELFEARPDAGATEELNPSTLSNPDPSRMVAGFARMAEWVRNQEAKSRDSGIPDPLGAVHKLLSLPKAPTEWVATEILALALQRVSPYADPDVIERASEQLGRDLTAQDPRLKAAKSQRSFGTDGTGKRIRKWGYDVAALRAAAERARQR